MRSQSTGMDVLADVLSSTRLGGTVFARSELSGSWGLLFEPAARAGLHIVARGSCWLSMRGRREPVHLVEGDVVLLPHGAGHSILSHPEVEPLPFRKMLDRCQVSQGPHGLNLNLEGHGRSAVLLCGAYRFEHEGVHPLLSLLPPLIHLHAGAGVMSGPLGAVLALLLAEYAQPSPGTVAVTARLVDVLFIQIIRGWLEQQPVGNTGWLGAVRDPQVGRALALMHEAPQRNWTVESLAAEVACSRATFARRFRGLVGETPLVYLTRLRMDMAARLLRDSATPLAAIAERVGYSSEFAFNRTFHRLRGTPPGRYREQVRAAKEGAALSEAAVAAPSQRRVMQPQVTQGPGRARRGLAASTPARAG